MESYEFGITAPIIQLDGSVYTIDENNQIDLTIFGIFSIFLEEEKITIRIIDLQNNSIFTVYGTPDKDGKFFSEIHLDSSSCNRYRSRFID